MIELLGNILGFVFDMVGFALDLAFGAVEFVFGLLGGMLSLVFSLGWLALIAVVIVFIVKRRKGAQAHANGHIYEETPEEDFVSFYATEEAAPFTREE